MHSASPYEIRSYDRTMDKKHPYSNLDDVGGHDTFLLLRAFMEANSTNYTILGDSKQVYKFTDMVYDETKRLIYGWFEVGVYGYKSSIINTQTLAQSFDKKLHDADVFRHFIYIYLPKGCHLAVVLLHSHGVNSVKTLFHTLFGEHFSRYTRQSIQMNPLSYEKAFDNWMEAAAKEVRLTKFVGLADIADQVKLGHADETLIYKSARRLTLGKLKDYLTPGTDQYKAVALLSELCAQVKTQVELGGKKRVFNVGVKSNNIVCEIDMPEENINTEGLPDFDKTITWCQEITNEFIKSLMIIPKV